jgi:phosphate transport system permease protein
MNNNSFISQGEDRLLAARRRSARLWQAIFSLSTLIAIITLATLLASIVNQSFGIVAVEQKVAPETVSATPLEQLPAEALVQILRDKLTKNRIRPLERDNGPLAEMEQQALYDLVIETVIQPKIVKSYYLIPSLLNRKAIEAEIARDYPKAENEFHSWINARFLTSAMSAQPETAGVRTALLGSLFLIAITILVAFPIGVGAAIYLEEYADSKRRINQVSRPILIIWLVCLQ